MRRWLSAAGSGCRGPARRWCGAPPPFHLPAAATVPQALHAACGAFASAGVPDPALSACHLLSEALQLRWATGFARLLRVLEATQPPAAAAPAPAGVRTLSADETAAFLAMCGRRIAHEPVQYILGQWDFAGRTLRIRAPMLCPRPETEELVSAAEEEVRALLAQWGGGEKDGSPPPRRVRVLDVGCGTGAVGLALAAAFPKAVEVVAIDVLPEAVRLAEENAAALRRDLPEAAYRAHHCAAGALRNGPAGPGSVQMRDLGVPAFDVVVANPPYIPSEDMASLPETVRRYEDQNALCGGADGLDVVRDIVDRLPEWTAGREAVCWLEVDRSHPPVLKRWLDAVAGCGARRLTVEFAESRRDAFGAPRFVKLRVAAR